MSQEITKNTPKAEATATVKVDGAPHPAPPAPPVPPPAPVIKRHTWRRWGWCLAGLLVVAGLGYYFTPSVVRAFITVSTDDAYVNFVKVVQRLPVRVELTEPNPEDDPLFIGLSVVPSVFVREPPQGPNAGARLQPHAPTPPEGKR